MTNGSNVEDKLYAGFAAGVLVTLMAAVIFIAIFGSNPVNILWFLVVLAGIITTPVVVIEIIKAYWGQLEDRSKQLAEARRKAAEAEKKTVVPLPPPPQPGEVKYVVKIINQSILSATVTFTYQFLYSTRVVFTNLSKIGLVRGLIITVVALLIKLELEVLDLNVVATYSLLGVWAFLVMRINNIFSDETWKKRAIAINALFLAVGFFVGVVIGVHNYRLRNVSTGSADSQPGVDGSSQPFKDWIVDTFMPNEGLWDSIQNVEMAYFYSAIGVWIAANIWALWLHKSLEKIANRYWGKNSAIASSH